MNYVRLVAFGTVLTVFAACEDTKIPFGQPAGPIDLAPPANSLADGLLALSGKDTAFLGDSIRAGDVAFHYHAAGANSYCFVFVDEESAILEDDYVDPDQVDDAEVLIGDPDNNFQLRVLDDVESDILGISLSIIVDGVEAEYACNPPGTPGKDCRQIFVDRIGRTITLNSVQMEPTSGAGLRKLTIDGQLSWTAGGE
jgi:hypothetical protein